MTSCLISHSTDNKVTAGCVPPVQFYASCKWETTPDLVWNYSGAESQYLSWLKAYWYELTHSFISLWVGRVRSVPGRSIRLSNQSLDTEQFFPPLLSFPCLLFSNTSAASSTVATKTITEPNAVNWETAPISHPEYLWMLPLPQISRTNLWTRVLHHISWSMQAGLHTGS